jgi:hypothetical protein
MQQTFTPRPMPLTLRITLGAYVAALAPSLVAAIVAIWPSADAQEETRYLLCAAAAGALGSCIHVATSFIEHAGHNRLTAGWAWWYFLRPWIGSALALVVYFVVRAGLITGSGDGAMNPYGVAALSGLSGMFSPQATTKLREIFENICAVDRSRRSD